MLLTGLLLMAHSTYLLTELRTTSPGGPTVGWTLPHQSRIMKVPFRLPAARLHRHIFLVEVPSSQMTLPSVKLT